ncbi:MULTISPECIES: YebB family permuted papain-like enzyme [unclassified Caballeronia]|uniref:YebB family permuted papain-like enzyme n=1 Tax=unclassified Caballeronia TaxID=2646786 RepID=UPI002857A8F4|nr:MULTISPECIES: YebB family permuted papain-like enzyme [unclassified Caballeronia]MDR5741399.1 YebB family permuted papain-like enzyme [Caballeronia sp. LZ016]MDR5807296.1 YebB family permuted papain-like enzyme [Caballeronia sp. LZ019]
MLAINHAQALPVNLQTGDVVFVRVRARPFREISIATESWTHHVGIVIGESDGETLIAESAFPLSRITTLRAFIARSEGGRVAVGRLRACLTDAQKERIAAAARRRIGIWYDTGFNMHSTRQFCSRFVHEVLRDATGVRVGEVETFAALLARQPGAALGFWRLWHFGRIPWRRETVTPASLLNSSELEVFFESGEDGVARPMIHAPHEAVQ